MDSKGKTIVLGVLIGAVTGLAAALMLNRRVTRDQRTTAITAGEGMQLGIMVFGLLRAIGSLGENENKS